MNIRKDYYPGSLAYTLIELAGGEFEQGAEKNCENALYNLMAICENEHNHNSYRVLWEVLQNVAEEYERTRRTEKKGWDI